MATDRRTFLRTVGAALLAGPSAWAALPTRVPVLKARLVGMYIFSPDAPPRIVAEYTFAVRCLDRRKQFVMETRDA